MGPVSEILCAFKKKKTGKESSIYFTLMTY